MRSKLLVLLLMLVMLFAAAIGFIGCGGNDDPDPTPGPSDEKKDFQGVELTAKTVNYDGTNLAGRISVKGAPDGALITYVYKKDGVVVTEMKDAGEYKVSATVTKDGYNDLELPEVTFTINKADMTGLVFADKSVTYDGTVKTITVEGVPAGETVTYLYEKDGQPVTEAKDAGVYTVTATIGGKNYNAQTLTKTLTIGKGEITGVSLANSSVRYDGTAKSLAVAGLPAGATVVYAYTKDGAAVEAANVILPGAYTVTAKITLANYEDKELSATLTVEKGLIAGVTLSDNAVKYDGTAKSLAVAGLPAGATVVYAYTKDGAAVEAANVILPGTYSVTATVSLANYEDKVLSATLTVNKGEITGVVYEDDTVTYDGNEHMIYVNDEVTTVGTTVQYTVINLANNKTVEGRPVDAGRYKITARVIRNYYEDKVVSATLTIKKADFLNVTLTGMTVKYDGAAKTIEVANKPAGATVTYTYKKDGSVVSEAKEVGTYTVTAVVSMANYNDLTLNAEIIINANTAVFDEVVFNGKTVKYDGNAQTVEATNLPDGATVNYRYAKNGIEVSEAKDAGTYTVYADLTLGSDKTTLTATLIIEKADFTGLSAEDLTVDYDGSAKTIEVTGLPAGATVSYVYMKNGVEVEEAKAAGTYTVTVTVSMANYNDSVFTKTITVNAIELTGIVFGNKSVDYDGSAKTIEVTNLPAGATVTYTYKKDGVEVEEAKEVGAYEVSATITHEGYITKTVSATLIINAAGSNYDGITLGDDEFDYDGTEKTLTVSGDTTGVTVNYEIKKDGVVTEAINAGVYEVTATLSKANCAPKTLMARLTINKKVLTKGSWAIKGKTTGYTGSKIEPRIIGDLDEGLTVTLSYKKDGAEVAEAKEVGAYEVTATFSAPDSINYEVPSPITVTLYVNPAQATLLFNGEAGNNGALNVTYRREGFEQSLISLGEVVEGDTVDFDVEVLYKANAGDEGVAYTGAILEEGIYVITVTITNNANYNFGFENNQAIYEKTLTVTVKKTVHTVTFKQEGQPNVYRAVKDYEALTDIPEPVKVEGKQFYWIIDAEAIKCITSNIVIESFSVDVVEDTNTTMIDISGEGNFAAYDFSAVIGAENLAKISAIDAAGNFGTGKYYLVDAYGNKTEVADITAVDLTALDVYSTYTLTREYEYQGIQIAIYSKALDIFNSAVAPVWNNVTDSLAMVQSVNFMNKELANDEWVEVVTIGGIKYYKVNVPSTGIKDTYNYYNFVLKPLHTKDYYELYRGKGYTFNFSIKALNEKQGGVVGQAFVGTTKNLTEVLKANEFSTITYTLEDVLDKKWDLLTDPATYAKTHTKDGTEITAENPGTATDAYAWYKTEKGYGLLSVIGSDSTLQSFWLGQFFMTNETIPSYTDDTLEAAVDTNNTALDLTNYISSENRTNIDAVLNKGYSAIYRLTSATGKTVLGKTIDSTLEENRQIWTIEVIVGTTVLYKGQVDVRNTDDTTAKWVSITEESAANAFVHGKNGSGEQKFFTPTYEEFMGRKALKQAIVANNVYSTHFSMKPLHAKEYYEQFRDQGYKFSFEFYFDYSGTSSIVDQVYTLATVKGGITAKPATKTWHKVTVTLEKLLEKWDNIFVNYQNETWSTRDNVYAILYWYALASGGNVYVAGFDLYKDTATVTVENYYEKDFETGVYEIDADKTTTYEYGVGFEAFYQVSAKTGYELDLTVPETVTHGTVTAEGLTLKLYYKVKPAYTVEYYTENGYGTNDFTKVDTKKLYADTGTTVEADISIVYQNYEVDLTTNELSGTVDGNMTLVLKVYYKLKPTYTIEYYKQNTFGADDYSLDSKLTKTLYATIGETVILETPTAPDNYAFNTAKSILTGEVEGNATLVLKIYYDLTANLIGMVDKKDTTNLNVVSDTAAEYTYQLFRMVDGKEIVVADASGLFASGAIDISGLEGQYKVIATDTATGATVTSAFEVYDSTSGEFIWNEANLTDMAIGVSARDDYNGVAISAKEFTIVDAASANAETDALIAGKSGKYAKLSFDNTQTSANVYMNLARLHSEDYYKQLKGLGYVLSFKVYSTVAIARGAFVGYGGYAGNTQGYFMDKINNGRAQNSIKAGSYDIISLPFDSFLLSADNQVSSIGKVLKNGLPAKDSWDFSTQMLVLEISSGLAGGSIYIGDFVIEQVPDVVYQNTSETVNVNLNGQETFDLREVLNAEQREKYDYIVNKYDGQKSYSWANRALVWTIKTGNGNTITVNGTKDSPAMLDVVANIENLMSEGVGSITASIRGTGDGYAYPSNIVIISKATFSNFPEIASVTTNYYLEQDDGSFVIDDTKTTSGRKVVGSAVAADIVTIDGYYFDLGNENGNLAGTLTAEGLTLNVYYKKGAAEDKLVDVNGLESYDLKSQFTQSLNALEQAGLKVDVSVVDCDGVTVDSVLDTTDPYAVGTYSVTFSFGSTVIYSEKVDVYNSEAAPLWDYVEGSPERISRAKAIDWNGKKQLTGDENVRIETIQGIDYYAMTVKQGGKAGTFNYQMFGLAPVHTKAYYELFRDKGYSFSYVFKAVTADGSLPGGQFYLGTTTNMCGTVKNDTWHTVTFTLNDVLDNWDKFTDPLTQFVADGTPWGAKGYGLYSVTGKDLVDQVFYVGQFFISNEEIPTYKDDTVYTAVDTNNTEYDITQHVSDENLENLTALLTKYDYALRLVDVNGNVITDTVIDTTVAENRKLWKIEVVVGTTVAYTGYVDIYNTDDAAYWNEIKGTESENAAFVTGKTGGSVALAATYEAVDDGNGGTINALKVPNYTTGSGAYDTHISFRGMHSKAFYEQFRGQGYYFTYKFYVDSEAASKLMNQAYTLATTSATGIQYFENKTWHTITVSFDTLLDKWDNMFVNYGEETWGNRTNVYAMLYWNTAASSTDPVYVAGFEMFKADVANVTTEVYYETAEGSGEFVKEASKTETAIARVGAMIYANVHNTLTKKVTDAEGTTTTYTYTFSSENAENVVSGEVTAEGLTLKLYYTVSANA